MEHRARKVVNHQHLPLKGVSDEKRHAVQPQVLLENQHTHAYTALQKLLSLYLYPSLENTYGMLIHTLANIQLRLVLNLLTYNKCKRTFSLLTHFGYFVCNDHRTRQIVFV